MGIPDGVGSAAAFLLGPEAAPRRTAGVPCVSLRTLSTSLPGTSIVSFRVLKPSICRLNEGRVAWSDSISRGVPSEAERDTETTVPVPLEPETKCDGERAVSRPRVLIADDHKLMVQSLVRFLDQDFDVVATVSDGQALVDAARWFQPDVIVADISMPGMTGSEAFAELKTDAACPFIFLSAYQDAGLAADLIGAGAAGFVLKQAAGNELVDAIREVLQGGVYVSPLLSSRSDMRRLRPGKDRSASS